MKMELIGYIEREVDEWASVNQQQVIMLLSFVLIWFQRHVRFG
jgi:hypothetical protein